MAFRHVEAIEVLLYGRVVGAIAPDARGRAYYAFEYYPSWLRSGHSISPLHLPLTAGVKVFPGLAENTWQRLPAAIVDALPDRFGNSLIEARLAQLGVTSDLMETLINCLCGMKRKAPGAQKPRHIKRIVEVASTAQRSDSPAQAINQGFLITPLDRLAYVADRAMGALEFRPARSLGREPSGIL